MLSKRSIATAADVEREMGATGGGGAGAEEGKKVKIGVLALQGAFSEHCAYVRALGATAVEIRTVEELKSGIDGLIMPGGESTAMELIAKRTGIWDELVSWVRESGKPVWGTCAGCILLANELVGGSGGDPSLVGGMDTVVHRNFFGSQRASFEAKLKLEGDVTAFAHDSEAQKGIFIRAPAILRVGPTVQVLAKVHASRKDAHDPFHDDESTPPPEDVIVAATEGRFLATTFHPELTPSTTWHRFFLNLVLSHKEE